MDMKKEILKSRGAAEVLLAALITARATSYMFSKLLLETMGQFTLLGLRSLLAFAVLLAISFKYLKATKKRRCYIRNTRRSLSFYSHVPGTFRP